MIKTGRLGKRCIYYAVVCMSNGSLSPHHSRSAQHALAAVTDLWQLLQQSLLLDRRNASDNRDCPDTTNLTNTLQMLTHLHMQRKCILVPHVRLLTILRVPALHLPANLCRLVEQTVTLETPTTIDIEPLCLSFVFCSMHAASHQVCATFAQHAIHTEHKLGNQPEVVFA